MGPGGRRPQAETEPERALGVSRTCVGCRKIQEQRRMVRLVADASGDVLVNPKGGWGRGAYLCPAIGCLEKAWQRKVFPRAFRRELPGLRAAEIRSRFEGELRRRRALLHEGHEIAGGQSGRQRGPSACSA